jgi:8-oxo-dGTP diphosphatase
MFPLLVTAAIIEHEGRFLLTRRRHDTPYPGLWEFPGGKLEPEEDPRICVVRELKEELDIEIKAESIYDVIYYRYPERAVLVMAYRCRWLSGNISNLEVAEHCWLSPPEFVDLTFLPADIPLVERLSSEYDTNTPPL